MIRKSRVLALVLCSLVCFSGCHKNETYSVEISTPDFKQNGTGDLTFYSLGDDEENSINVSELEFPDKKPIPEGGWTYDTLMDSIWINGKNVHFPCKFEDLGDGFEFNEEYLYVLEDGYVTEVALTYKDQNSNYNDYSIIVRIYDETKTDYTKGNIFLFDTFKFGNKDNYLPVYINGITFKSNIIEMRDYCGYYTSEYTHEITNTFSVSTDIELIDTSNNSLNTHIGGDEQIGVYSIAIQSSKK